MTSPSTVTDSLFYIQELVLGLVMAEDYLTPEESTLLENLLGALEEHDADWLDYFYPVSDDDDCFADEYGFNPEDNDDAAE